LFFCEKYKAPKISEKLNFDNFTKNHGMKKKFLTQISLSFWPLFFVPCITKLLHAICDTVPLKGEE
jgi:hypothetical protein